MDLSTFDHPTTPGMRDVFNVFHKISSRMKWDELEQIGGILLQIVTGCLQSIKLSNRVIYDDIFRQIGGRNIHKIWKAHPCVNHQDKRNTSIVEKETLVKRPSWSCPSNRNSYLSKFLAPSFSCFFKFGVQN